MLLGWKARREGLVLLVSFLAGEHVTGAADLEAMSGALLVDCEAVVDVEEVDVEVTVGVIVWSSSEIGNSIVVIIVGKCDTGIGLCARDDGSFTRTPPAITAVSAVNHTECVASPAGTAEHEATGSPHNARRRCGTQTNNGEHSRHDRPTATESLPVQLNRIRVDAARPSDCAAYVSDLCVVWAWHKRATPDAMCDPRRAASDGDEINDEVNLGARWDSGPWTNGIESVVGANSL